MASILSFRAMSDLAQRAGLALRAGLSFGGDRDMYKALGYQRNLDIRDYRARFKRGGIAKRIVTVYPKATWRGGAELIEDEDPEVITAFEEAWDNLNKRLNVWTVFCRADILAGLGNHSTVLIGAPGDLESPLEGMSSVDDVMYLAPFGEDEMPIDTTEDDPTNERFGLPKTYRLRRKNKLLDLDKRIHYSRVIHVVDDMLDVATCGTPRLEAVWNHLDDLDKITGGGSEAFWMRVHQGLFFNIDSEAEVSDEEIKAMKVQAEEFAHNMKRTMAMKGAEVTALGSDVSNFSQQVSSIISLIAGTTGIPQRLLLGSERGELASTQDKENWDSRVRDRRDEFGDPLVRQFVDRLIAAGALPEVDYQVRWPDIEDLNDDQRATIADKWAQLNKKAGGVVVLPEEIRDRVLRLEKLTEDQLAEIEQDKIDNTPDQLLPPGAEKSDGTTQENQDQQDDPAVAAGRVAASARPKA